VFITYGHFSSNVCHYLNRCVGVTGRAPWRNVKLNVCASSRSCNERCGAESMKT
jgi:hypothetical protein